MPDQFWTKSNKNGHCEYAWDYYNCFAVLLMTKYQSQIISKKFRSLPVNHRYDTYLPMSLKGVLKKIQLESVSQKKIIFLTFPADF